jgi:hypothetical protein
MIKLSATLLISCLGSLLSACGGGSGDSSDTSTVQQKIDLTWTAPATRTDGAPLALSELQGYRIYLGTTPENLALQEELIGVSSTQTTLLLSAPGVYYFAVTAYDFDGLESSFSDVVSKEAG